MSRTPAVMVSSTFYDLKQLRENLSTFLGGELGWRPLLSEHASFPVDPDVDTVENCRRRVQRDADIFVLVVGGRYGSIDDRTRKSITNLEYLAARAKGIPIYVFVSKGILPLVPVWEKNPDADFTSVVDDPALFEFVQEIRAVEKAWVFEFDYAGDIIAILRQQLAFLVGDWMRIASALRRPPPRELEGLSPDALRIALEEPVGWPYLLFFTMMRDEVDARSDLRRAYALRLSLDRGVYVEEDRVPGWIRAQLAELRRMTDAADGIFNEQWRKALGGRGEEGDKSLIIFIARQLGMLYARALEWAQEVRRTHVDERFQPALREFERYSETFITNIEQLARDHLEPLKADIVAVLAGEDRERRIELSFDLPNAAEFERAFEEAIHSAGWD